MAERARRKRRPVRSIVLEGRLIDRRFRRHWKSYLFQCALCMLALLAILLVVDVVLRAAIVVAIASTAFIVFVLPHSQAANPRRIVGGHLVAVLVGSVLSLLYLLPGGGDVETASRIVRDLIAVVTVGISILIMVLTDTEHPPAAGTALGLVVVGWTPSAVLFVVAGALTLSAMHWWLRPYLKNLL
ncbi:MAG: HPP family protein [Chloroflexi bacterium]|nr:HPP family protein [Chloroflexota bacterium]